MHLTFEINRRGKVNIISDYKSLQLGFIIGVLESFKFEE